MTIIAHGSIFGKYEIGETIMNVFEMIESQQAKLSDTEPAWMVGEQLKDICRADPRCAELVEKDLDAKGMSLTDCEKKIKAWSDKNKKGSCCCVPPHVAEGIIRKFYGLPGAGTAKREQPKKTGVIDLFSFV